MDDETSIRAFYKKLVQLRKEMDVISEGRIEFVMKEDDKVLAYRRYTDSQEMLVLCNLTDSTAAVQLPQGWEKAEVLLTNYGAVQAASGLKPYECIVLVK